METLTLIRIFLLAISCFLCTPICADSYEIGRHIHGQHLVQSKLKPRDIHHLHRRKKTVRLDLTLPTWLHSIEKIWPTWIFPLAQKLSREDLLRRKLQTLLVQQKKYYLTLIELSRLLFLQAQSRYWAEKKDNQVTQPQSNSQKATSVPGILSLPKDKEVKMGDYIVTSKKIGKGQFGKVFLGRHATSGQTVAAKLVDITQNVVREIHAGNHIQHPNVVTQLGVFRNPQKVIIIMEYCAGGDLKQAIENNLLKNNETLVKKLFWQFLQGLQAIESQRFIHRDLKPENLFLSDPDVEKATLKIADFGFAKQQTQENPLCQSALGSPLFMAPERLNQKPYDFSAEMWAAGTILYQMLYGDNPFAQAQTFDELIHLEQAPLRIPHNDFSQESAELIHQLLQVDPSKRITLREALTHPWFTAAIPEPAQLPQQAIESKPAPHKPITVERTSALPPKKPTFGSFDIVEDPKKFDMCD